MNLHQAAPGVGVTRLYANVFLLNTAGKRLLVDTGTVNHSRRFVRLLRAFDPHAVLVTHSHIDHAGNAFLASRLGYPVLAHPLEHPRLLGKIHDLPYPAGQPRLGQLVSRLHPRPPMQGLYAVQEGEQVHGWEVIHLPGHTDGQIGLRRGGVLLAADAVLAGKGGAHLPRAAYNWNHDAALHTLKRVAGMDLHTVLPGHGGPLTRAQVQARAVRDDP